MEPLNKYKYETHLHTVIGSRCSNFQAREIVEKYTALGYAGVFVTDHFLNGNTTVPSFLPWKERISLFMRSYECVRDEAKGRLDVFFGFEYSYLGTDFLVYGLGADWLSEHPEIMGMSVKEFLRFARSEGGFCVQAHPYREASYIDHVRLFPAELDGLETVNATQDECTNGLADILANAYTLCKTAGSDIHTVRQNVLAGVAFGEKITSERDYAEKIKRGEGELFTVRL